MLDLKAQAREARMNQAQARVDAAIRGTALRELAGESVNNQDLLDLMTASLQRLGKPDRLDELIRGQRPDLQIWIIEVLETACALKNELKHHSHLSWIKAVFTAVHQRSPDVGLALMRDRIERRNWEEASALSERGVHTSWPQSRLMKALLQAVRRLDPETRQLLRQRHRLDPSLTWHLSHLVEALSCSVGHPQGPRWAQKTPCGEGAPSHPASPKIAPSWRCDLKWTGLESPAPPPDVKLPNDQSLIACVLSPEQIVGSLRLYGHPLVDDPQDLAPEHPEFIAQTLRLQAWTPQWRASLQLISAADPRVDSEADSDTNRQALARFILGGPWRPDSPASLDQA